ncbi:MAG: hypothetical protein KTR17_10315 [Cellvibrionaceae bacterium]|nr:hypothetical protein [Cellvibrionaceae bacterium]
MSKRKNEQEFFVGYSRMPSKLSSFYKKLMVVLILLAVAVATWLGVGQRDVGSATWDAFNKVTLTGYLSVDPYPVLQIPGDKPESVLLVRLGKLSAEDISRTFQNQPVSVSGFPIQRGGWRMLEIETEDDFKALDPNTHPASAAAADATTTPFRAKGEIVDSKCFLGVMKPGAGKVHRACAQLCLKGGIPPIFVVKNSDGEAFGYLLTRADGTSASTLLAPFAAVPVEISGNLQRRGDLVYLRMDDNPPRQLSGHERADYGESLAMASIEEHNICHLKAWGACLATREGRSGLDNAPGIPFLGL